MLLNSGSSFLVFLAFWFNIMPRPSDCIYEMT
uniref:Uncharacterized protein n=1 Tax=Rhizophora mucronata TaxID=61149 RepID=A0A2P2J291_RHIMU